MNLNSPIKKTGTGVLIKYIRLLFDVRSAFHRRFVIFLFFVALSTIFWLIRSLDLIYEAEVEYPVKYQNFPENKVLIGKIPDKLTLRVRASGFSILKSRLNLNIVPLKFDVNSFSLNSIGRDTFYILTESIRDILSEELNDVRILQISPDTLYFRFTDKIAKKLAVIPDVNMNSRFFKKQYMLSGKIKVIPDSIIVSGPENLLTQMTSIKTEQITYFNLSDTVSIYTFLQRKNFISFSQRKVRVIIPVDKFTEVEESLPVVPINVPDSLSMVAIPGQVKMTYRICLGNYSALKEISITPLIDFDDIKKSHATRLMIFLPDTPQFISDIRFSPKKIEYVITRK